MLTLLSDYIAAGWVLALNTGRSGNIREVSIFTTFAYSMYKGRIQESRENYYYNSATNEK